MSSTPKTPSSTKRLQSAGKGAAAPGAQQAGAATPQQHSNNTSAGGSGSGGLLDVFPVWSEQQPTEKEDKNAGKYEDPLGLSLPPAAGPFCDAWKRSEELLQGLPAVPMVCLRPAAAGDPSPAENTKKGAGKEVPVSLELDGKLYAGHETFDWLLAVISHVMAAEKSLKRGDCLWELISPKDKDGLPTRSPSGRYRVKLFLLDTWRTVTVDDRIPLDLFGRSLLVGSRPLQLWPLLLCKAILKVMAVYRSLDMTLPHQVAAFQMLTGWPQEDLLDALGGTPAAGGTLFDRLEDVLPGPTKQITGLPAIASCCLVQRSKPQRAPPRLVVLSAASAVGRSQLVARLLAEFPDKFGVTVSHTSRPPREHEVDGKDYFFTTKQQLLSDARGKAFLETARVAVHSHPCNSSAAAAAAAPPQPLSYWYGTSLATVRDVAATGKLCVMSLDVQGAEALRSNPRIDGLYLYISTSTPEVLAQRQRQRLTEAASTQDKKLAWAKQQVAKSSTAGLFDNILPNTGLDQAYAALKEAISKLSPIIRNRLRGLPAYVLDYSDLIPPNSVEKPFLKPVILAGPHTGERRRLLEMLVEEFPDVFALPRQYTTRPPDLHSMHVGVDGDELQLVAEQKGSRPHSAAAGPEGGAAGQADATAAASADHCTGTSGSQAATSGGSGGGDGSCSGDDGGGASKPAAVLLPPPRVLSKEAFEAAVASGQLLEHHADLFTHPLAAHRHGHSLADLQDIIRAGKLPLLELEAEQTELVKVTKAVDCLSIFLAPPSMEEHAQRLQQAATETEDEVAARGAVAAAELAAVRAKGVFDDVLVNDDLEEGYAQLLAAISKFRPDLIPSAAHDAAARAAQQAAASTAVPLLIAGPAGGGKDQLVQQLLQRFPQRFAVPCQVTDRKPSKGEKEAADGVDFVKPDVLSKMATQGQVVWSSQDAAAGGCTAVTAEAVSSTLAAGKMAVLDVGAVTAEQLQILKQHPALQQAFTVYVCRLAVLKASMAASGTADAAAEQTLASVAAIQDAMTAIEGLVQAVVTNEHAEEAFTQLQEPLSAAYLWAMPPLLQPLVVAGPFGSGKRAVLQRLVRSLPDVLAVPKVVTSKPHAAGRDEGMEVVSLETAQQMRAAGQFLVHQEVLGHIYGIPSAAVRKLQALGKLPLLDLDRVQDVEQLRAAGFQAAYLYLQPHSLDALEARIRAEVLANPPLLYEPEEAAAKAPAEAVREAEAAASSPQLFDAVVPLDPQDLQTALGKLGLELHQRYPFAVPSSFVWGFGRPLWNPSVRVLGLKPLRVMVLGPAASGKSMQCSLLADRFAVPHINVGDLLYAEVAAKTPLGLEAQRHMDSSKTVPDRLLMGLLLQHLEQQDCKTHGWVLDGFPHTRKQAQELAAAGHVPDKVILLEGPHALLLNRVKFRRVDYTTGKVYHLAEAGALSEAIRPLKPDGSVDADIMARLSVRHDDSMQNVANRLALWDRQVPELRAAYEDVTLRLPAAGSPAAIFAQAESFVRLEAELPTPGPTAVPGSIWPLVDSWKLEELTYRVVSTLRYKRQQLVQLQQLDGKLFWCNLKELAGNSSCMLLAHNPAGMPVLKMAKRLDTSSIQQQQLLMVDSPEPFKLLTCLSMGPHHLAVPPAPPSKQVVVLVGPTGSGRTTLAQLLLSDYPAKLAAVPLLTDRGVQPLDVARVPELCSCRQACNTGQAAAASTSQAVAGATPALPTSTAWPGTQLLKFVPEQQFRLLQQSQQLLGVHEHMHHSYAVSAAAVEQAAEEGKAALVVGSVHLAAQLKQELPDVQVVCVYVDAEVGSLDKRIRQQAELDEQQLQGLLSDALQQRSKLQALQEQQGQLLRDQGLLQQGGCSAPQTPAPTAAAAAKGASPGAKLTVQLPQMSLPSSAALQTARAGQQQQQQQPWLQQQGDSTCADQWLFYVPNMDSKAQVCYTHVKGILAKFLPVKQQFQPGLLLLQHHPSSAAYAAAAGDRPATARQGASSTPSSAHHAGAAGGGAAAAAASGAPALPALGSNPEAAALIGAAVSGLGLDDDAFHASTTVLRLRALTAASGQLVLPRGRHLLQLQCCPSQLHCVSFYASSDCTLDSAEKLLPLACKLHVERASGNTQGLAAGSRQLLFRYLLKPSEPCCVSVEYQATSAALQASTQLMLLEVATGRPVQQLQQPSMQLAPSPKGYLLLALCEPLVDVPAGGWSVVLTSDRKLPALAELPCSRQVVFSGVYGPNTKAVMARFVVSPTAAVNLAVLAQLRLTPASPQADAGSAALLEPTHPANLQPGASTSIAVSSSDRPAGDPCSNAGCPLRFAVQVFDTAGAKEVAWHASYALLASVQSQDSGRASLPNLHLGPGKYLLVLQLLQDGSRQWVDPATGSTTPLPEWQLLLVPSADDKACPIVQDDAWQRHFEAAIDTWQQQAVAAATAAAAAGATRPGSSNTSRAALAAAKERGKAAQAALERHVTASAAAAAAAAADQVVTLSAAPSSAAAVLSARVSTGGAGGNIAAQQAAAPAGSAPAAAVKKPAAAAAAAAKGKAAAGTRPITPAAAAAAVPGAALAGPGGAAPWAGAGPVPEPADSSASPQLAAPVQLWPGSMPAAAAPAKPPAEVVIRQVKSGSTDTLQLSPADQMRVVTSAHASSKQPAGGAPARPDQLLKAADSSASAVEKAASSRAQLQAAAAHRAEEQVVSLTSWREQTIATQQAALRRKQDMLQSLFPFRPVHQGAGLPPAGPASKAGSDKIPAGKVSK